MSISRAGPWICTCWHLHILALCFDHVSFLPLRIGDGSEPKCPVCLFLPLQGNSWNLNLEHDWNSCLDQRRNKRLNLNVSRFSRWCRHATHLGGSSATSANTIVSGQVVYEDAAEICPLPWLLAMLQTSSGLNKRVRHYEIGHVFPS